jgi:RHS repeat-associated protein
MEVNVAGVRRAYVYAGGKQVAQQSVDGQFYWLHTNHLGSSRAMTDVNGNLVYKGQFDPYGQVLMEWGSAYLNTKKFTGYERDAATGLDYARARTYNSGRGRFVQPDPKGSGFGGQKPHILGAAKQDNPQSLNRYTYVNNDPMNLTDPSGLLPVLPDGCPPEGHGQGGETCAQCLAREESNCVLEADACLKAALAANLACIAACAVGTAGIGTVLCLAVCLGIQLALSSACEDKLKICRNNKKKNCPQCPTSR